MFFSPCLPHIEIIKILLKWKLCGVQRCVFSWIGLQNWVTEVLYTQTAIHRGLDLLFKLVITFNKSSFVVFLWALSPVGGIIDIGINKNQGSLGLLRLSKDQKTLSLRINITLKRVQIERPHKVTYCSVTFKTLWGTGNGGSLFVIIALVKGQKKNQ